MRELNFLFLIWLIWNIAKDTLRYFHNNAFPIESHQWLLLWENQNSCPIHVCNIFMEAGLLFETCSLKLYFDRLLISTVTQVPFITQPLCVKTHCLLNSSVWKYIQKMLFLCSERTWVIKMKMIITWEQSMWNKIWFHTEAPSCIMHYGIQQRSRLILTPGKMFMKQIFEWVKNKENIC